MKSKQVHILFSLFLSACLLSGAVNSVLAAEYNALKGLKAIKAVFDVRIGDPKKAAVHLDVIRQTCRDKALQVGKNKPAFAVVFSGPAVKLLSTNRGAFSTEEGKALDDMAATLAAMAKEGTRLEVCLIALKLFGVDAATVLPEIHKVENGFISLIGHQANGYTLIPAY